MLWRPWEGYLFFYFLFLAIYNFFMLLLVTNNPLPSSLWCEIWPLIILIVFWAQSLSYNYFFVVWHRGGCGSCVCHQCRHHLCRYITVPFHPLVSQQQEVTGPPPLVLVRGPLRFILSARATVLTETLDEFFFSLLEAAQQGTHLNQSLFLLYLSLCAPKMSLKVVSKSIWTLTVGHSV